jgi:hypothetical protein
MEKKFFRAAFGMRQLITLGPALIMAVVWVVMWLTGETRTLNSSSMILGLMIAFWMGTGIWRIFSEGYTLEDKQLVIVTGPQKVRISYDSILRVMSGDVTMPGSRMARGALLIEQEGAARGQILYPRDMEMLVAEIKARAPEAIYITTAAEYDLVKERAKKG